MKSKTTKKIILATSIIVICLFIFTIIFHTTKPKDISSNQSVIEQNKKIKILIIPGHEPNNGGADYKSVYERNLNLELAKMIDDQLSVNKNYDITLVRDDNGWNSDLKNYVETGSSTIMSWVADLKQKMLNKVYAGEMKLINPDMKHNAARSTAVLYLYGTNKWAKENNFDLILNIHFNNNPKINGKPNYSGYCIYVPEKQYVNASSSRVFANYLNDEISKIEKKSNMPEEKNTILEDQQLIAMGSYETLNITTALVEYAYIYEPMMVNKTSRNIFMQKAASSTVKAINNYLFDTYKK